MNRFFIAGCQRSGTTLLRLIMDSHSAIHCFDEVEGYRILTSAQPKDAVGKYEGKLVGFKIPRFTEQLLLEYMSDIDYGEFASFYNGEPVVFLVRDYRDVIRSMMQLRYPDGESWIFKYGQRILKHQSQHMGFKARDHKKLIAMEQIGFQDCLVGALYWKYKTDALFSLINAQIPVVIISYERLVKNPKRTLEKLIHFLGLPWENSLLKHYERDHAEVDENGLAIGGTDPKLPIHKNSIKSHEGFFSQQELKGMHEIVCDTLDHLSSLNLNFNNVNL